MIQVFKTYEEYVKWLNGQTLPSGIVVYVSDDETMYFSTNNIRGELKTYKCEKEEPIIYSANAAGSTITVNGETVTLKQGDNITLDYPNEITSVKATDNKALTYIKIPNTVTSIEDGSSIDGAFYNCTSLDSVALPNSLTSIGSFAFYNCYKLTHVSIPESVTSIEGSVFYNCYKLTHVNIPESVTSIEGSTFYNCISLDSVILPNSLTSIKSSAFNNCRKLTHINIPESVTSIEGSAFYNCTSLDSVILPNSLTSIEGSVFRGCNKLPSITIPSGVKSINYSAFANCSALTDFNFNGTTSQWASITLGIDWNKDAAFTVVHCTDGDVTL